MRPHRTTHASRSWQPLVTEWPRPPGIALAMSSAIPLGWVTTLEGGPAARAGGSGVTWWIDLVLGFMAIPGETSKGESHGVACLLMRPMLGPALDRGRLAVVYRAWHEAKEKSRRKGEDGPAPTTRICLQGLVLTPLYGPPLACGPLEDEQAAWQVVTSAWDEAERFEAAALQGEGPSRPAETLLRDQPALLAYQDTPQQLWDPARSHDKPSTDSSAELVPVIEPPTGRGRPRSFAPMNMAMAITDALIELAVDGPPAEVETHDGRQVDMRALFALELVLHDDSVEPEDRQRLESWLLGGHKRAWTADDLRRRSRDLRKKLDNWHTARKTGRRAASVGANEVRKIVPTLIFDRAVFLKPIADDGTDPLEDTDATLVDWLRSPRVEELVDVLTGRRREKLAMACCPDRFDSFLEQRGLPFHRIKLLFNPEDEGYRGAVAMLPGAQPGAPVICELTGFAEDADALTTRLLGELLGHVISTHTVPAGQPWPPLAPSSITSPPSSFGT